MFEKAKGLKMFKKILKKIFGAWGFLLIDDKMYLVSHSHVKNSCKICDCL